MLEGSTITALLGPTNSGKTHRAIERMLEHESGMIGLPLRLLAREVYDRVTARVGEARVALVTGEEKRVPRRPDYWVCTVEAMPVEREVDFVAIDEVQLCGHPQRGHVFTERLLGCRGRRETWFLGASTMRAAVSELVPTAKIVEHPRLSKLSFAGAERLTKLPPRSAVVAFSAPQVYEIAERLRQATGGCAVVLGALSPRTRNAQVAMFQAGEVDRVVATDAIGMGLNLQVGHVAFAALRKFDGRGVRDVEPAEVAQIAGRAGRNTTDGTFGTVDPLQLAATVAIDVEASRFAPVRRLSWRNAELDFASIDALIASLRKRPPARALWRVDDADDVAVLALLAREPWVRERARGEAEVRLLWAVCSVPDYRKLLLESHASLLLEVFGQLSGPRGCIDVDWLAARVHELDDVGGEIEALMGRISAIRTFTFLVNRSGWVDDEAHWQEEARAIEDRLSDALHDRLVQRFVDRGRARRGGVSSARSRSARPGRASDLADDAPKVDGSHPFAALAALRGRMRPTDERVDEPTVGWVDAAIDSGHDAFGIDERGRVAWRGRVVGQLVRGPRLTVPDVALIEPGTIGAGARSRLARRLVAVARDAVESLVGALRGARAALSPGAGHEAVYQIEQGLGSALLPEALALSAADVAALAAAGVLVAGRVAVLPATLSARAIDVRCAVCTAFVGAAVAPGRPREGVVSFVPRRGVEAASYAAVGYPVIGPRAVRADVAARVALALREKGASDPQRLAALLGCSSREAIAIAGVLEGASRTA